MSGLTDSHARPDPAPRLSDPCDTHPLTNVHTDTHLTPPGLQVAASKAEAEKHHKKHEPAKTAA